MDIRLSKYNAPFRDSVEPDVHFISLDDQADMRLGRFDAHVRLFYSVKPRPVVIGRPFAKPASNFSPIPVVSKADIQYLDELAYKTKIHAAKKRLSKEICFSADKSKPVFIDIYKTHPIKKQRISKAKQFLNSLVSKNNS